MRVADLQVVVDPEDYDGDGSTTHVVRLNITLADDEGKRILNPWFVKEFESETEAKVYAQSLGKQLLVG